MTTIVKEKNILFWELVLRVLKQHSSCFRRQVVALAIHETLLLDLPDNPMDVWEHLGWDKIKPTKVYTGVNYVDYVGFKCMKCRREQYNLPSGAKLDLCEAVHAEEEVLRKMVDEDHSKFTLWVTTKPCASCTAKLNEVNFKGIYYLNDYKLIC